MLHFSLTPKSPNAILKSYRILLWGTSLSKCTLERPGHVSLSSVPETTLNLYTKKKPLSATVADKYRISDPSSPNYCWHVVLDIAGSQMARKYRIGQSVGVIPTGRFQNAEFNLAHNQIRKGTLASKIRLYSIASACWGDNWEGNTISLCVKRELQEDIESGELVMGAASNYICDAAIGDQVMITGPVGKSFLLPDNPLDHNYVFAATGTGIAPYRGMLIELFNQGFEKEAWLFFGVPYSTDIMYDDEFRYLDDRHSNFHYVTAISREQTNDQGGRMYVQDRLAQYADQLVSLLNQPTTLMYLCGLKGMEYGIYPWLYGIESNLVKLPDGLSIQDIQDLPRSSKEWPRIERARDRDRLFKETY